MSSPIDDAFDYRALARQQAERKLILEIERFPRLAELGAVATPVSAHIVFALDPNRNVRLTGSVRVELRLACQRCLEQVTCTLEAALDTAVVRDEDAAARVPEGDVVVADGDQLVLASVLEDDLLMSLPTDRCPDGKSCVRAPSMAYPADGTVSAETAKDSEESESPFAVLAALKAASPGGQADGDGET